MIKFLKIRQTFKNKIVYLRLERPKMKKSAFIVLKILLKWRHDDDDAFFFFLIVKERAVGEKLSGFRTPLNRVYVLQKQFPRIFCTKIEFLPLIPLYFGGRGKDSEKEDKGVTAVKIILNFE